MLLYDRMWVDIDVLFVYTHVQDVGGNVKFEDMPGKTTSDIGDSISNFIHNYIIILDTKSIQNNKIKLHNKDQVKFQSDNDEIDYVYKP